ncbi:elongation factor P--(R)-beta-lysine ligase [Alteromonas sp. ASW11-36]|uniref:Elongation factor P--(R)-beta-lysine ligase n=1 Tax=Alteromonas arenosi TaxID=3055817 RepID=A0ABT7SZU9_9ALTE|nr:elongation factor P--(R)-beta-lysine ligase [Alteromonas sp. ASW11-36]MDM7861708.1 elongation factor P--(R)-beta-lysine ligase [Alteromonas sp. ASW11-36]
MSDSLQWQPTAPIDNLRARAELLTQVRAFFSARNVLEVETPVLSQHATTDCHIQSISTSHGFLQTSPEFAMKRLLAAGSGSIFQICKAFRQEESGRWHNPEFTMLEWYRVGFDHHTLMAEVDALLQVVLACQPCEKISYQQLFIERVDFDPLVADKAFLSDYVRQKHLLAGDADDWSFDDLLQVIFNLQIEPHIGQQAPVLVYGYPASQSALARINTEDPRVADRFEAYYKGVELANGFFELSNADEQRQRFESDNHWRRTHDLADMPMDVHLIDALAAGLPDCAGVALGIDRLLMLKLGATHIDQVLSFPFSRA